MNYKSAALTLQAVQSVLASSTAGRVRVVVVDNSADRGEAAALAQLLPPGTERIVNEHNAGFGNACNQVYQGAREKYVLLLNPDTRLLPGALGRLRELCEQEGVGAVGPQIYWDDNLHFLLPPSCWPLHFCLAPGLSRLHPEARVKRLADGLWRSYQIRVWQAEGPLPVLNLSGGHVLLKREAVERAGGLFDPRYFLYFEDTDLFLRLRKAGYRLWVEPRARVVHYYDQCGKLQWQAKRKHMRASQGMFTEKHCHGWQDRLNRLLRLLL